MADTNEAKALADEIARNVQALVREAHEYSMTATIDIDAVSLSVLNNVTRLAALAQQAGTAPKAQPSQVDPIGEALNDAAWAFVGAMPHQLPGAIFNCLKGALRAAIETYLATSRAQAQPPQAVVANVTDHWTDAKLRGIASDYFPEAKDWPAAMLCMRHLLMEQRAALASQAQAPQAQALPPAVLAWLSAEKTRVAAVNDYNEAHAAAEKFDFGAVDLTPHVQRITDTAKAARRLLPAMYEALSALAAQPAAPQAQAREPLSDDALDTIVANHCTAMPLPGVYSLTLQDIRSILADVGISTDKPTGGA